MRLLIVEDSAPLAENIARAFRAKGHTVECVHDGEDADAALSTQSFDLVVLDLGLPGLGGLDVLRRLRHRRSRVPVLVLTARDAVQDRVTGLNAGADDYLCKPFALEELEARVGALLRRGHGGEAAVLSHGRLTFDTASRCVAVDGEVLPLPRRELTLLEVLLVRRGQVVAKETLRDSLFGYDEDASLNAVETYVHRLRRKLEPFGVCIRTVRGLGYLLEKP
jgi:two-component system, OmpR family, response regulator